MVKYKTEKMRGGLIDTGGEVSEEVGLFLVSLKPGKTYELKKQSVIRRRKKRRRRRKKKKEEERRRGFIINNQPAFHSGFP